MKHLQYSSIVLLLLVFALVGCQQQQQQAYKYDYLYKDLPFEMPKIVPPSFPDNEVSISDFGGIGDGQTKNTEAFAKAFAALDAKGGGTLKVPFGVWYTGPIEFKSNINLHLAEGALILFSTDFEDYKLVHTSFEGLETRRCQSPITAKNLTNVAITGHGAINGSGHAWRPLKKGKVTARQWKEMTSKSGVFKRDDLWYPTEGALKGSLGSNMNVPGQELTEQEWEEIKVFLRPVMVSFINCKNVFFQDVLFENSPSWNVHPLMCENVILDNVYIRNPSFAQNGDGLDLESCKNSIVVDCTFDVGDDGICIKSGKDEDGRKRGMPTENVIVENCKVFQGHGGFVVGSEMSGGVKNIKVNNCQFLGTDVGLRFKSSRGRGGVVENIYISNISMFDIVTESFRFNLYYGGKSASEANASEDGTPASVEKIEVTEETPAFRNIFVKNLVSRNAHRAMLFHGLPEMKIQNIVLEDATITAEYGAELYECDGIKFKNVHVKANVGTALKMNEVSNYSSEGCSMTDGSGVTQ